ncbi:hypothetical protein [Rhodohalobacter sp. 614A]|uniref:hypothetical protein n=1 Tax=Rhodohalobacter sp. 614A TaxID=2908649 RepID=UPI001F39621C|nr:hypothetical protein [Rhodohalobacter sp. 614A]
MKLVKLLFFLSLILIVVALLGIIEWSTLGFILALMIGLMIAGLAGFLLFTSFTKNRKHA